MKGKKTLSVLVLIFIIFTCSMLSAAGSDEVFDVSRKDEGVLKVNYPVGKIKVKVMVQKGSIIYYYDLKHAGEAFPLQIGSGNYTVSVLENIDGDKYKVAVRETIKINLSDDKEPFLQSVQTINWDKNMKAVNLAKSLTKGLDRDEDKTVAIYNYIVQNIEYDKEKINKISNDYIPDIDDVLQANKGICYDYSSLFAAMLRSVGIPAKLIKGYNQDAIKGYHAWNEVFIKEKGEWVTIDTTYDAAIKSGTSYSMIKSNGDYEKTKEY